VRRARVRPETAAAVAALSVALATSVARADEPPRSGIERPGTEPGDGVRGLGATLLWPLRRGVELIYEASEAAAGLVESQQIVPRARDLMIARDGSVGVYPTFSIISGYRPMPGARMLSSSENVGTTLSAAWAGGDDYVTEARVRFTGSLPTPAVISIEGLHDRRSGLGFGGVGMTPLTDPRNHFLGGVTSTSYREARERLLASLGLRPSADLEVFLSSSFTERTIEDDRDGRRPTLADAFAPDSRPGSYRRTRFVYSEIDLRLDTRPDRARPSPGVLVEGYGGSARGVFEDGVHFVRAGLRTAAFAPVHRRTNVLSPKIVLDGVAPIHGELPFEELVSPGEFRGVGGVRDHVSLVTSLDYRWMVSRIVAARLFVDAARVAPSLEELPRTPFRWAVGAGADISSASAELGRVGLAAGPDGVAFLLSFGVPSPFGDRQHRD
jgi:hypothetical protein